MQRSLLSVSGIVILGVILLLSNGISDALFSRFYVDLTEDRLYSLSPGTSAILKAVEEPITFHFYFSKTEGSKFPGIKLYGTRIADLLREYERQSKGNITLETYDPRPDTEEEEWAQKYGVTPLLLPTGEKLYMGLVAVNSRGEEDVIPVFELSRQEFLEYDVSKLVYSLTKSKKSVVGVISSLDLSGQPDDDGPPMRRPSAARPWVLMGQLSKFADVKYLPTDTDSIGNVDVLLAIHPKNLPEQTLYAIDQYAVKGGSVFVAIDPHCATDQPKTDPNNPLAALGADRSSNMKSVLAAWGVSLIEKKVVADINLAARVATGQDREPQSFPVWLTLGGETGGKRGLISSQDETTGQLENMMFPWPGAIELKQIEGLTSEVLFRTTDQAMLFSEQDIRFSGDNPEEMLRKYQRGSESYVLGVRIRGKLKSSFPGKPGGESKEAANMSSMDAHIGEGFKDANIMVVADVDFLADHYAAYSQNFFGAQLVTLINDNLVFASNAVENLSGSNDLISLRSRGKYVRPFTKVQEIEARAQEKYKEEEELFQAKLNQANQRLSQLQSGSEGSEGKKGFTTALVGEIKRLRDERADAQRRLREVRRKLREDKERLGLELFLVDTFLIPLLLIAGSVFLYVRRAKRAQRQGPLEESGDAIVEEASA